MEIKDKTILITGGASGIGKASAEMLMANGANVCVLDKDIDCLDKIKSELPDIKCVACDITIPSQVEKAVARFGADDSKVDILINNAGIIYNSPLIKLTKQGYENHDIAMWDKVIATNLSSVFYVSSVVARYMIKKRTKGLIINVSSICASGNAGQSAYSAAKAGVEALTITWAKELSLYGIRVAGIAPGFTVTDSAMSSMSESVINEWIKKTPLRRMAMPAEIAGGIRFIIQNDFFNGRTLEIDGGLRI